MKNANMPAMPNFDVDHGLNPLINGGLTKREYFAAMAMQGLAADYKYVQGLKGGFPSQNAAKIAVKWADALLEALDND